MNIREIFKNLYRLDLDINKYTKYDVENVIEKINMYRGGYKAGLGVTTLRKMSGLTEQEIRNMPEVSKGVVEELTNMYKFFRDPKDLSEKEYMERLRSNEEYLVRRILDNEMGKLTCKKLGLEKNNRLIKLFMKELTKKGYLVENLKVYNNMMKDVHRGKCIQELVGKYKFLKNEDKAKEVVYRHVTL